MNYLKLFRSAMRRRLTRGHKKRRSRIRSCVTMEILEPRQLLTSLAWNHASDLTISFAPEDTDVGGQPNEMFSRFAELGSSNALQSTLTNALNAWMSELGLAAMEVNDEGQAFGATGNEFGDSRFGDVRVAAVPLAPSVVALSVPYTDTVAGTWSGDVLFNTNYDWSSLDEVYSVALHEFGHVLGLEHNEDPTSAMFAHTGNEVMTPSASDVTALHRVFKSTQDGNTELEGNNDDARHAQRVEASSGFALSEHYSVSGTLVTDDVDYYEFAAPEDTRGATIVLQTPLGADVSVSLQSRKGDEIDADIVFRHAGRIVLRSKEVEGGKVYRVRIQDAATTSEQAPVDYKLTVTFGRVEKKVEPVATGQTNKESPRRFRQLTVEVPQLMTFGLEVTKAKKAPTSAIVMSVFDADGNLKQRFAVDNGSFGTGASVLLKPGGYLVAFDSVAGHETRKVPELEFELTATTSTDPVGPGLNDPTYGPEYEAEMMRQSAVPPYIVEPLPPDYYMYMNPPPPPPPPPNYYDSYEYYYAMMMSGML